MATVVGNYVKSFAEASHALPEGMHMNADYPFMLPRIASLDGQTVTLEGRGGQTQSATIKHGKRGEYCEISQSSSFERLFNRKPAKFRCYPFKDEHTEAIGGLFPEASQQPTPTDSEGD